MTHDPREALEIVQQMIRGKPMEAWITDTRTRKSLGDVVQEALTASPGEQKPVERYSIEFDGFTGTVIGSYTTLEGKDGVVLQQDGTRVVHVYGRKHLKPAVSTGDEAKKSEGGTEGCAGRPWPSPKPDTANDEAMASLDRSSPVAGVEPGPSEPTAILTGGLAKDVAAASKRVAGWKSSDPTAERREIVARFKSVVQIMRSANKQGRLMCIWNSDIETMDAILAALDGGS